MKNLKEFKKNIEKRAYEWNKLVKVENLNVNIEESCVNIYSKTSPISLSFPVKSSNPENPHFCYMGKNGGGYDVFNDMSSGAFDMKRESMINETFSNSTYKVTTSGKNGKGATYGRALYISDKNKPNNSVSKSFTNLDSNLIELDNVIRYGLKVLKKINNEKLYSKPAKLAV
jgi:hypothetical protein